MTMNPKEILKAFSYPCVHSDDITKCNRFSNFFDNSDSDNEWIHISFHSFHSAKHKTEGIPALTKN